MSLLRQDKTRQGKADLQVRESQVHFIVYHVDLDIGFIRELLRAIGFGITFLTCAFATQAYFIYLLTDQSVKHWRQQLLPLLLLLRHVRARYHKVSTDNNKFWQLLRAKILKTISFAVVDVVVYANTDEKIVY